MRYPLLDIDLLLHNRLFAAANAAALLNYMALYAVSILTAIFLEVVQGTFGRGDRLDHAQPAAAHGRGQPVQRPAERQDRFAGARARGAW